MALVVRPNLKQKQLMFALRKEVFVIEQHCNPDSEPSEGDLLDQSSIHFVAVLNDQVVGTIRLHNNQLGKLVVHASKRHLKIGSQLVRHLEVYASDNGFNEIVLDSREQSVGFYLKLGYTIADPTPFLKHGIEHLRMTKVI